MQNSSDALICNACGKVYLEGDLDGRCDDPRCMGAKLDKLIGFVSYRRACKTHRGMEHNDLALRIKDRVEKVLHARQMQGGFFIDKTGIEREDFEQKISNTLRSCRGGIFLLILTPGALDEVPDREEDWLIKEIRLAMENGLEIVPVIATKYRQDADFAWPRNLSPDLVEIKRKNVNLSFIGDMDEHYLVDSTQSIASEIICHLGREASSARNTSSERPAQLFRAIGIDLGGTKIRGCLTEMRKGEAPRICHEELVVQVKRPCTARSVFEQIKSLIEALVEMDRGNDSIIKGIGVAAAGQVDLKAGVVKFAPSLGIRNLSLKSLLANSFRGVPIRVDNDVRCATRCEMHLGVGQDFDNFICVFVGTGVGSGIVINSKIVYGSNYCAGEIGHTKIASDGPICSCGQTGCLEAFVNSAALVSKAQAKAIEWRSRGLDTQLSEQSGANTPFTIARALETGDVAAQEVADEIGKKLGVGLANCLNAMNPGAIVLGGGIMTGYSDYMSGGISWGIRENALSDVANTPLIRSEFSDNGAAIGAALLFHPDSDWAY
jgi:predicted NBD/HSP70 family sugar kinase